MLTAIAKLTNGLIEAGGSVVGVRDGTEEPAYRVEQVARDVELRHYGPRIAAETIVTAGEEAARNIGFRRLAGYIFGGNHSGTKIAMTAPVAQQQRRTGGEKIAMTAPVAQERAGPGQWVIRFFMPAEKTMETLPTPNDAAVRLVTVPDETVAVRRFTGCRNRRAVASQAAQLMTTVREIGLEPAGTPAAWFYDPPWTVPMLRRNEVVVAVET